MAGMRDVELALRPVETGLADEARPVLGMLGE
jgi:hypothetical protein